MSKDIYIGMKIKTIREARGLSQAEVVERLAKQDVNMSRETLSKIENDNRSISAIELNVLCKVLSIDINILLKKMKKMIWLHCSGRKIFRRRPLKKLKNFRMW